MMPKGSKAGTSPSCSWLQAHPAPQICASCIGMGGGVLSNTQRMMTGPAGETVGVRMSEPDQVRQWLEALDTTRCPCLQVIDP